ncbi:MAG: HEAT repeat domain-containing protein [Microcoleaceae cyanobacterium]
MKILELIRAVEEADSAEGLLDAVEALAEAHSEEAISTLITVLGYNNPGAAVAAVDGLIALGEPVVTSLLEQLDGYNYGARAWAIRALSGIGDPRSLEVLLEAAATDFALSVRRAAASGLGTIRWEKLPAPEVASAQLRTFLVLLKASEDPEWIVRYAAVAGLEGLGITSTAESFSWYEQLLARLVQILETDESLAVQARAKLAQKILR